MTLPAILLIYWLHTSNDFLRFLSHNREYGIFRPVINLHQVSIKEYFFVQKVVRLFVFLMPLLMPVDFAFQFHFDDAQVMRN